MLPHTVYCRDKEGPQHTHQEYMCCTGHQRAKGWIKQWEGTEQRPTHPHALRTHRRADLRAGGAHAHPGRSRAVAQSRALLTQEAVGELLT